ncbi:MULTISPECIES: DUF6289 family protein [Lysobacter]|uniref:DUF6289 family protein n=1 Tax=Lysobacter TaxID=68 RepID=UPI0004CFEF48|nr:MULTISPECIES: DUF6289 family protein [Lysobacter]
MKRPVRTALLIAASLSALAFGASVARPPPTGSGWIEYKYYDSSNNLVGARLIDCTGIVSTFGVSQGRVEVEQGPCF